MKHGNRFDIQLFFTGFILSVIFVLFLLGMLLVHSHISQSGTVEATPLFSVESSGKTVTICIIGEKININREIYRRIEPTLQKLCVFLPPGLRLYTACCHQLRLWEKGEGRPGQGPPPGMSLGTGQP
ncbi:MAG: hypothetical protein HFG27_06250 [Provencibacterium sp.]|jgi:hypothetical protein|nr:hypothetical protein [Provencibacterium sp.]